MPSVYLDPSTNENILLAGGGTEEAYMNLIVDAMIPYLRLAGIDFARNNPDDTLEDIIRDVNAGDFDIHMSLRALPDADALQGPIVYYNLFNPEGQRLSYDIARNLWEIYPRPEFVDIIPTPSMEVLNRTKPLAVVVDLGNSANLEDADWIRNEAFGIARTLVAALAEYLQIPLNLRRGDTL